MKLSFTSNSLSQIRSASALRNTEKWKQINHFYSTNYHCYQAKTYGIVLIVLIYIMIKLDYSNQLSCKLGSGHA